MSCRVPTAKPIFEGSTGLQQRQNASCPTVDQLVNMLYLRRVTVQSPCHFVID